ncbi:MAG: site-2 protease family protein [Planctomycetes bacterium]|nr:site-2 protease family protein [Planctomycetota bacterium]
MSACPECGTHVAPTLLQCPGCRRLVHADELKRLAAEAEAAAARDELTVALAAWRQAQPLLPHGSRQAQAVAARVEDLVRRVDAGEGVAPAAPPPEPAGPPRWGWGGVVGGVGGVALLLWKFKALPAFLLTKGKLLLAGLTQWTTLASMLLAFGVYWTVFGWWFAAGLVLSIYVHEMGHVVALRRLGLPASAPMFIPGVGAVIRLRCYPPTPREDARVGLAGPMWGLGAALAALGLFLATGEAAFAAIARVGAWINLFNLMPLWQLDGARGWRALGRAQRWTVTAAFWAAFLLLGDGLLLLLGLAAGVRALGAAPATPDRRAFVEFLLLVAALTALCALPVPLPD